MENTKGLSQRWLTARGQAVLLAVISQSKSGSDWQHLLRGFPNTDEVDNGRDLRCAPLSGRLAGRCDFSHADLRGIQLEGVHLVGSNFVHSLLDKASFTGSELQDCNFHCADLSQSDFLECQLSNANLSFANLTGACLWGADLYTADLTGAILDGAAVFGWRIPGIRWCNPDGTNPATGVDLNVAERWLFDSEYANLTDLISIDPWGAAPLMVKVFISYSWSDQDSVLAVDQALRDRGIRTLIDRRDFTIGAQVPEEIERNLRIADKVVIFYSKESASRQWPTFERKLAQILERARGGRLPAIIYFCLDDTELPLQDSERICIRAFSLDFLDACTALYHSIIPGDKRNKAVDISRYNGKGKAPWQHEG